MPERAALEEPDRAAMGEAVANVRCHACNRKLAEWVTAPWYFRCPRCKARNIQLLQGDDPELEAIPRTA